jgi:hypothetical protein
VLDFFSDALVAMSGDGHGNVTRARTAPVLQET